MTGEQFDELKRWFVEDWARSRDTFDPITIINADTGGRIWMSRMCHDLVEYGFKRLAEMKVNTPPNGSLLTLAQYHVPHGSMLENLSLSSFFKQQSVISLSEMIVV